MTYYSLKKRLQIYLIASVREDLLLETQLLILAFATGMQDASTFPDYHCFASNQTGNTVLFAVGIAGLAGSFFTLSNTGTSLAAFVLGCWVQGQLGNFFGRRKRWWLFMTSFAQTSLVFVASFLQYQKGVVSTSSGTTLSIILLLAFSSGGQVAMVRSLGITEITTAMATAAYVDICVDENLFLLHNRQRNRRVLFLLSLLAGSFAGAFAYAKVGSPFALLMSAVGKFIITCTILLNKKIDEEETECAVWDDKTSIDKEAWADSTTIDTEDGILIIQHC